MMRDTLWDRCLDRAYRDAGRKRPSRARARHLLGPKPKKLLAWSAEMEALMDALRASQPIYGSGTASPGWQYQNPYVVGQPGGTNVSIGTVTNVQPFVNTWTWTPNPTNVSFGSYTWAPDPEDQP